MSVLITTLGFNSPMATLVWIQKSRLTDELIDACLLLLAVKSSVHVCDET